MHFTSQLRRAILFLAILTLVATAAAETNTIQIYVHPGSGNVCLDNTCQVDRGTITGYSSTQFLNVAGGQFHTIRVYDTEGYQDTSEQVYMDINGNSFTRRIYLEPVSTQPASTGTSTGTLKVYVSPGLGQVCLDTQECESSVGEPSTTWSVRFDDVATDTSHTITVTADGYQTSSTQVTVLPDRIGEVDVTLLPLPQATAPAVAGQPPQPPAPPQTTKAPLDGSVALFAAGICGAAFVFLNRRE
jgi:hypothetical protein